MVCFKRIDLYHGRKVVSEPVKHNRYSKDSNPLKLKATATKQLSAISQVYQYIRIVKWAMYGIHSLTMQRRRMNFRIADCWYSLWSTSMVSVVVQRRAFSKHRTSLLIAALLCTTSIAPISAYALQASSFVTFESGQVRPLAMSHDGQRLYAVNTPDNRLEIFDLAPQGLRFVASIAVGMEPVAVAARNNGEVWVVNHLSDSVSIVDTGDRPRVVRTLLVGDEPNDIVFAGPEGGRAFITTAHRGQHSPWPPSELQTEGINRADVWVFKVDDPGASLGGDPETIVTLFGDKPRALAVTPDGKHVYAAVFHSGNRTATVHGSAVCDGGADASECILDQGTSPGGLPLPNTNYAGVPGPEVGLIVEFDPVAGEWRDELGRRWNDAIRFDLPDYDVFMISADTAMPAEIKRYSGVGTILFNMAVNPANGKLYVSNTHANNRVRFEGAGEYAARFKPESEPATLMGHLHESRVTVIDGDEVHPRHLNKHIDYDARPVPAGTKEKSLATPLGMALSSDGKTMYLAAMGSSSIGVFDTARLEQDTFEPNAADHITVNGGGPTGVVLDEPRNRLYTLSRFDNTVRIIDLGTRSEMLARPLHNPEPASVVEGRPFLYDARLTSSNGEASCAACHVFGDMDDLAWDLGNPDLDVVDNPNPFLFSTRLDKVYHPMKGPLTTQSLRGLENYGPMHWRADRSGALLGGDPLDEELAFKMFNVTFPNLLGREEGGLDADQMQAFTDYVLQLYYPPNPIRSLDNVLSAQEQSGKDFFFRPSSCGDCHPLEPENGFFGGNGFMSPGAETQDFKVPHLRNVYQKVGMFAQSGSTYIAPGAIPRLGPQVRGFGYLSDGGLGTTILEIAPKSTVFSHGFQLPFDDPDKARTDIIAYINAFDSNLKPIVGQQVTLGTASNGDDVIARLNLMVAQAAMGNAELVAKLRIGDQPRGAVFQNGKFVLDRAGAKTMTLAELRRVASGAGHEITFTAVPPGSGWRMGVDQDEDGVLDSEDVCPFVADQTQVDADQDAIGDACDNCVLVANAGQRDTNGDGYGNACDGDLNNDEIVNITDLALLKDSMYALGDNDADMNGNGVVEPADLQILRSGLFSPPGPSAWAPF